MQNDTIETTSTEEWRGYSHFKNHRATGKVRSWCFQCGDWCYATPDQPERWCFQCELDYIHSETVVVPRQLMETWINAISDLDDRETLQIILAEMRSLLSQNPATPMSKGDGDDQSP